MEMVIEFVFAEEITQIRCRRKREPKESLQSTKEGWRRNEKDFSMKN